MSYAAIAKQHIPEGEMPQPDQGLVDGHFSGETEAHQAVDSKINVLPAGSDPEHPDFHPEPVHHHETITVNPPPVAEPHVSEAAPKPLPTPHKHDVKLPEPGSQYEHDKAEAEAKAKAKADKAEKEVKATADKAEKNVKEGLDTAEKNVKEGINTAEKEVKRGAAKAEKEIKATADKAEKKAKELANKAKKEVEVIESKLGPYWEKTKDIVLRPGTLGGLMGVVNVGILSTIGYFAYTRRDQPWDQRIVAGSVLGPLALFGAEGYVADSYLSTEEGQREAERAKREGSKLYMEARERILRPQVAGGLVGAVNIAILGTVGYFAHQNWNRPWDRRTVSAIAVGLLGLSGLEGYAGKVYADKH